jgi:sterol 3beta-glucosyltransferase
VLAVAFGTRGDVLPILALCEELQRRGIATRVAVPSDFVDVVRQMALNPVDLRISSAALMSGDLGLRWVAASHHGPRRTVAVLREIYDAVGPTVARVLSEEVRRGEAIASTLMTTGVCAALAEARGVTHVQLLLAPMTPARNPESTLNPLRARPSQLNQLSGWLGLRALAWASDGVVDALREELGLPRRRVGEHVRAWRSTHTIYGVSPLVVPSDDSWPSHTSAVGFWFPPSGVPAIPDGLDLFLSSAVDPVYIGLGSMIDSVDRRALRSLAEEAAAMAGVHAVIGMGHADTGEVTAEHVFHVAEVDHAWLFPRVRAVVHHGGAGTTAQALRAATPSVVVPVLGDQPYWGRRVRELGVGVSPIPLESLTAQRLAESLRALVRDRSVRGRAELLARKLAMEDGVGRGADEVLRLLT